MNSINIFIAIIALVIAGTLLYSLIEFIQNMNAEEEVTRAELIDKVLHTNHSTNTNGANSSRTTYTLTFELSDGERKSFDVSKKNYLKYIVGDNGDLSFQRKRFNDFKLLNSDTNNL